MLALKLTLIVALVGLQLLSGAAALTPLHFVLQLNVTCDHASPTSHCTGRGPSAQFSVQMSEDTGVAWSYKELDGSAATLQVSTTDNSGNNGWTGIGTVFLGTQNSLTFQGQGHVAYVDPNSLVLSLGQYTVTGGFGIFANAKGSIITSGNEVTGETTATVDLLY
eukprot:TRINITY_DN3622_c0_g2_i1.p3 TRINITY_DN3622_c0_g2~~TRINITY_DN3622_c0_g2_i1.p3  ORF type:complete len:180 (+),score=40.34 TRINITY_DN3622_c0_g2_i1:48-542(+)